MRNLRIVVFTTMIFAVGTVCATKRSPAGLTMEHRATIAWINSSLVSIKSILNLSDKDVGSMAFSKEDFDELKQTRNEALLWINSYIPRILKIAQGHIVNAKDNQVYAQSNRHFAKLRDFIYSVNAAFLKIDILAIPSHVSKAYLIAPVQASLLKVQAFVSIRKAFFTQQTERTTVKHRLKKYMDAEVSKIVLALSEKYTIKLKYKLNSYDYQKLLQFRMDAIKSKTMYSENMPWFNDYNDFIAQYAEISRKFATGATTKAPVIHEATGFYEGGNIDPAVEERQNAYADWKVALEKWNADKSDANKATLDAAEKKYNEMQRVVIESRKKIQAAKQHLSAAEELNLPKESLPMLTKAIRQANLLQGTCWQIINTELGIANSQVKQSIITKVLALTVIIILFSALTTAAPGVTAGPVAAVITKLKGTQLFMNITSILQSPSLVGFATLVKTSNLAKALQFLLVNNQAYIMNLIYAIQASTVFTYVQKLNFSDLSVYINSIKNIPGLSHILKLGNGAALYIMEFTAKLPLLEYAKNITDNNFFNVAKGIALENFAPAYGFAKSKASKIYEEAQKIAYYLGVIIQMLGGVQAAISTVGGLLEFNYLSLLASEVVNLFFVSDPEKKRYYQVYYTLIELQKSVTTRAFHLNQYIKYIKNKYPDMAQVA